MTKEYKLNVSYQTVITVLMAILVIGSFRLSTTHSSAISYVVCGIFCLVAWYTLRFKIVVTDQCLIRDSGGLGRRIKCDWDQIAQVSQAPTAFLTMYKISCMDGPSIMIPDKIDTYEDLLREIIDRAPHAEIDDSIIKILEKSHNMSM